MADPIIGPILGLAAAIGRLLGPIKRFVDRVLETSKVMRKIRRELDSLSTILATIHHFLETLSPHPMQTALAMQLPESIRDCRKTIRKLNNTLDELRRKSFRGIYWAASGRDRVMSLRDDLVHQKSTFIISMLGFAIFRGMSPNEPTENIQGHAPNIQGRREEWLAAIQHMRGILENYAHDNNARPRTIHVNPAQRFELVDRDADVNIREALHPRERLPPRFLPINHHSRLQWPRSQQYPITFSSQPTNLRDVRGFSISSPMMPLTAEVRLSEANLVYLGGPVEGLELTRDRNSRGEWIMRCSGYSFQLLLS